MFTKKHLDVLASWIKWSNEDDKVDAITMPVVAALIPFLRESNVRFDRSVFIEACGWRVSDFDSATSEG